MKNRVYIQFSVTLKRFLFIFIVFFQFMFSISAHEYLKREKIINELIIVDTNFTAILDTLIDKYQKCDNFNINHAWNLHIKEVYSKKTNKVAKGFYFRRAFFDDAPLVGYGYFYHKGILFIVSGELVSNVFEISREKIINIYEEEPNMIFDPPRSQYYYLDMRFYHVSTIPCGG